MPAVVIHSLNDRPQMLELRGSEARVGRDPGVNQVVLPGSTVSREHAVFQEGPKGWIIRCTSETNPIVVDGALTYSASPLQEGSEILVGTEFLLVYSESVSNAREYLGDRSHFSKNACASCGWTGTVSALRRKPVCPKCGGTELGPAGTRRRHTASMKAARDATEGVDPMEVRAQLERLKTARRSHIERIDGRKGGAKVRELREDQPVVLGKTEKAHFRLGGLSLGRGVEILWDGNRYVARSFLFLPSLKVNGERCKERALQSGDVIEIGSNRFRFVTE